MGEPVKRTVYRLASGWWAHSSDDEGKGQLRHTSIEAEREARAILEQQGGGELVVLNGAGKVERRETINAMTLGPIE